MTDVFRLWGFDGELKGNEERLQARLPVFTRDGSDEVFLARKLDWSPGLPASDVVCMTAEQAEEAGERLDFTGAALPVVPGEYVAVTGPVLNSRLRSLGIMWDGTAVQENFSVHMMSAAQFDVCTLLIESCARHQFDSAIAAGNVTEAAREALAVMRNVGIDNTRPQLVRTLALHFLAGETDDFLRVLRLGAKRLQDDPERLKQEMREHLQFVRTSPATKTYRRSIDEVIDEVIVESLPTDPRSSSQQLFKAVIKRAASGAPINYRRRRSRDDDPRLKGNLGHVSLSDLELRRIDSKKLTNWIVTEEQAES